MSCYGQNKSVSLVACPQSNSVSGFKSKSSSSSGSRLQSCSRSQSCTRYSQSPEGPRHSRSPSQSSTEPEENIRQFDDAADAAFFVRLMERDEVARPPPLFNRRVPPIRNQADKLRVGNSAGGDSDGEYGGGGDHLSSLRIIQTQSGRDCGGLQQIGTDW